MSRGQTLIDYLNSYGGQRELGDIQDSFHKTTVAYSMTQAVSEARNILRPKGLYVRCIKRSPPSKNLYIIEPLLELFSKAEE